MQALLDAWELFGDAWLCALLLALLLPQLGLVLVLRHQLFLGAAIGQASALGFAMALACGLGGAAAAEHEHALPLLATGVAAAVAVAVLALRALTAARSNLEARAVVVFVLGGSGAMLLLADDPHGLHEVQRLQMSTLLGAGPADVALAAAALAATALLRWRWQPRALLWATDPTLAQVLGLSPRRYDVAAGVWLGLCIAFAIHAAGLLFTFGLLILPPLIARELCGSLRSTLRWAPWLGLVGTAIALVVAHQPAFDWPPAQAAVALLALAAGCVRAMRTMLRR